MSEGGGGSYGDYERRRVDPPHVSERRGGGPTDDPLIDYGGRDYGGRESGRTGARRRSSSSGLSRESSRRGDTSAGTAGLYGSQVGAHALRSAVAELVGTFILVFTGTAVAVAAVLERPTAGGIYDSLAIALAFGLVLAAIVAAIGHVSGAHVNPAVTIGLAAVGKFPWNLVPLYAGMQILGGLLGALATWITYGGGGRTVANLGATYPAENAGFAVGDLQGLIVEILVTFILVFVIVSVATDDRVPEALAPLAVGFALAAGVFIAGPVTGGSLNPARTIGPMLLAGRFEAIWIYILGPIIGAILAAVLYDRFLSRADAPS